MINELRYGREHKCPVQFVKEIPKDKVIIAVNKTDENSINLILELEDTALVENNRLYVCLIPLVEFGSPLRYNNLYIKIENLFEEYIIYQLDNIKEIYKV